MGVGAAAGLNEYARDAVLMKLIQLYTKHIGRNEKKSEVILARPVKISFAPPADQGAFGGRILR